MIKSLIDASGRVINIIEIKKGSKWVIPDGCSLIGKIGHIGDIWDGKKFIHVEPPPEEQERDLMAELDALTAKVKDLEARA